LTTYVIDTSVLVKYVLPAEHDDNLKRIVSLHRESIIQLVAPSFLLVECANVLWKNALRIGIPIENAIAALNNLRGINVRLVPQEDILEDALRLALNMEITVYDALYCAQRESAEIITEDRRLRNALDDTNIRYLTLQMWVEQP